LGDVLREDVEDKLLDVVEDSAAFFDGGEDRSEVVIG
jgi:hypothetical protein